MSKCTFCVLLIFDNRWSYTQCLRPNSHRHLQRTHFRVDQQRVWADRSDGGHRCWTHEVHVRRPEGGGRYCARRLREQRGFGVRVGRSQPMVIVWSFHFVSSGAGPSPDIFFAQKQRLNCQFSFSSEPRVHFIRRFNFLDFFSALEQRTIIACTQATGLT